MTLVYCGQTVGWIKMPLDTKVGLGPRHTARRGPSSPQGAAPPRKKRAQQPPPTIRPMSIVAMARWIKVPCCTEVGLSPGHIVLHGDPAPLERGTAAPAHFSAHCGQTAGCTRIPLDTEVGLDPGDIVFDGNPAPPRKGAQQPAPTFGPTLIWHGRPYQQICCTLVTLD